MAGDVSSVLAPAAPPAAPRRHVLGVAFDAVTLAQAVDRVLELARRPGVDLVLTPNVDHLVRAAADPSFAALCTQGSLVVADGLPVVWASRLLGEPLPERVAGSDLMPQVVIAAARAGMRYAFLGGAPGDAARAAGVLADRAGRDGCVLVECPPYGFERDPAALSAIASRIAAARPDLLFLGLGSPKQEWLMHELRGRVAVPVMMAVGVSFSFVAGTVRRAPGWLRRLGLEWAWRLSCEPRRLWRRYANDLLRFPWLVLRAKLRT